MSELTILIVDIEDEVGVSCHGDTKINMQATPAQILANELMKKAAEELKCLSSKRAEGGTVNIAGLLTTLAAVFGTGALIDNRRKDTVIKTVLHTNANNANKT